MISCFMLSRVYYWLQNAIQNATMDNCIQLMRIQLVADHPILRSRCPCSRQYTRGISLLLMNQLTFPSSLWYALLTKYDPWQHPSWNLHFYCRPHKIAGLPWSSRTGQENRWDALSMSLVWHLPFTFHSCFWMNPCLRHDVVVHVAFCPFWTVPTWTF